MNSSNTNPCKGCGGRKIGCHATCKDYISWRLEYDEENKKIWENKKKDKLAGSSSRASYTRYLKRRSK